MECRLTCDSISGKMHRASALSEKKRSGFELTAAECSKSALVVRTNEDEFELPTVVQENKQFGCNTICGFEGMFKKNMQCGSVLCMLVVWSSKQSMMLLVQKSLSLIKEFCCGVLTTT